MPATFHLVAVLCPNRIHSPCLRIAETCMFALEKATTPPDWGLDAANACLHDAGLLVVECSGQGHLLEQGMPVLSCACCLQASFTGWTSS